MSGFVKAVENAEKKEAVDNAAAFATEQRNKRQLAEMPSLSMRLNIDVAGIIDGQIIVIELYHF
jgi:hypothetical protein